MQTSTYIPEIPIAPPAPAVEYEAGPQSGDKAAEMVRELEAFLAAELANPKQQRRISFRSVRPGFASQATEVLLPKE